MRKGYKEGAVQKMFDDFYAANVVYEMTDQLIAAGEISRAPRWDANRTAQANVASRAAYP
jgi:hypothetical protein